MPGKMGRESLCGKRGRAVSFLPRDAGEERRSFYFEAAM